MRRRSALLPLSLAAAASCANDPDAAGREAFPPLAQRHLAGCYEVAIGDWDPPVHIPADEIFHEAPATVLLSTRGIGTLRRPEGHLHVEPATGPERWPQPGSWAFEPPDSLLVIWTDGYTGIRLEMRALSHDSARGVATALTDNQVGPVSRAPVGLRRLPCPPEMRGPFSGATHPRGGRQRR